MADQPTHDWRMTLKRRLTVTAVVVFAWSCAIEGRLICLQVFERADLAARADRQQSSTFDVPAKRGDLVDRNGHLLAYSVDADSVYGVPTELLDAGKDPVKVAAALCGALQDCTPEDRKKLIARFSTREAVRRRPEVRHAGSGEAHRRPAARGHRVHQGEPAVLSQSRSGGTRARLHRRRQRRRHWPGWKPPTTR